MTEKQQRWFNVELWPAACRAQGWKPSDRAFKLAKVGEIIGRKIDTTKRVHPIAEFDTLMKKLLALAQPGNEARQAAAACADIDGRTKRVLWRIETNVRIIRTVEYWLELIDWPADLADAIPGISRDSIDRYVATVTTAQNKTDNWRRLLLPILESRIAVTVEERKRTATLKLGEKFGSERARGMLGAAGYAPHIAREQKHYARRAAGPADFETESGARF